MREILGRRRKISGRRKARTAVRDAALAYAGQWNWRVVPGIGFDSRRIGRRPLSVRGGLSALSGQSARQPGGPAREQTPACACPRPNCPVPGAHPLDPGLLAATRDPRMVGWWWSRTPDAPIVLATGDGVSAASLPAVAGERALSVIEHLGIRLGPVIATPTRYVFLVAPYSLDELGELLDSQEWVPTSLRYHGDGGYVPLPPSGPAGCAEDAPGAPGEPYWVREPMPSEDGVGGAADGEGAEGSGAAGGAGGAVVRAGGVDGDGLPWLPRIGTLVDALVRAGRTAPDIDRLRY